MKESVGILLLISMVMLISSLTLDDSSLNRAEYCDNVALYKATGGRHGWPDFNNKYDEYCVVKS